MSVVGAVSLMVTVVPATAVVAFWRWVQNAGRLGAVSWDQSLFRTTLTRAEGIPVFAHTSAKNSFISY
jgi:hypothetical protein